MKMRGIGEVAAVLVALWAAPAAAQTVGQPAPDFHATLLDGTKVSLADYRGQVLVVNLWATWCGPCKQELPLLDTFYKIEKPNGLRVLALTTEGSVPLDQLEPLARKLTIPIVRNLHGGNFLRPAYFPLDGVPTNYVIDRKGVVRYAKAAAFDLDSLNAVLIPLLNEPAPADGPAASVTKTAAR